MPHPLRILHLTLGADAGGLSRYVIDLGAAMRAQGHDITIAGDTGAWQWAFDESQIPFVQIPLKGGLFAFRTCAKILRSYLNDHQIDVIHTHYRRATLLARKIQHPNKIPILYTLHLSHISLRFPRNLFTDFGDHTHAASVDAHDWLINDAHVAPSKISLIPHGVDVHRYSITTLEERRCAREHLKLDANDLVALFVGRLDDPKNEGWLIDIAGAARAQIPNLKIFLVGEGPHEPMLRLRIASENLMDRVFLTGFQDPLAYYRAADAILLPSTREGFSLVCAEAMATGIPALRSRTSGTTELIVENITGRSTPIDHDAFVGEAIKFLSNRDDLKGMGAAAAARVREAFTYDQQLTRTLDLYRSIAKLNA